MSKLGSLLTSAALAAPLLLGAAVAEETANPYEGFKVPPMEISSGFPYEHKFISILGSNIAYVDQGERDPSVFLHGQPTSSYLWRNIIPFVEGKGRIIAPDNIGFGKSDQPELEYTFSDHYRYFTARFARRTSSVSTPGASCTIAADLMMRAWATLPTATKNSSTPCG